MDKVLMGTVKFTAQQEQFTPVINMGTVMNICEVLNCQNFTEVSEKLASCNGSIKQKGIKEPIVALVDQNTYLNIAIDVLHQASITAYELKSKTVDFTRTDVKNKITLGLAGSILLWFTREVKDLMELDAKGNASGTIQII